MKNTGHFIAKCKVEKGPFANFFSRGQFADIVTICYAPEFFTPKIFRQYRLLGGLDSDNVTVRRCFCNPTVPVVAAYQYWGD